MSLDNIQLPAFLCQSIFKKSLIDLQKASTQVNKLNRKINFLGGNVKNIVFIVNNEQYTFLDDNQLKFLSGLINACNITMGDIAVVNFHNKNISYTDLADQLAPHKILSFGVSALELDLPFTIPFFQVQVHQEIQYMLCPPLEQLKENPDEKRQLWISLQKIFKLPGKK